MTYVVIQSCDDDWLWFTMWLLLVIVFWLLFWPGLQFRYWRWPDYCNDYDILGILTLRHWPSGDHSEAYYIQFDDDYICWTLFDDLQLCIIVLVVWWLLTSIGIYCILTIIQWGILLFTFIIVDVILMAVFIPVHSLMTISGIGILCGWLHCGSVRPYPLIPLLDRLLLLLYYYWLDIVLLLSLLLFEYSLLVVSVVFVIDIVILLPLLLLFSTEMTDRPLHWLVVFSIPLLFMILLTVGTWFWFIQLPDWWWPEEFILTVAIVIHYWPYWPVLLLLIIYLLIHCRWTYYSVVFHCWYHLFYIVIIADWYYCSRHCDWPVYYSIQPVFLRGRHWRYCDLKAGDPAMTSIWMW